MHVVPIILVGTFLDVRDGSGTQTVFSNPKPVKWKEGYAVAQKIRAYAYLECSTVTNEGVRKVFEKATQAALLYKLENKILQVKPKSPRLSKLIYYMHIDCKYEDNPHIQGYHGEARNILRTPILIP